MTPEEQEFKEKLEGAHNFPEVYTFKFIVKLELQEEVKNLVVGADISLKQSSGNKYVSVTLRAEMKTSIEVIEIYRKAKKIEGLIAL